MEPVGGDGRGVYGAVFILAHPLGAEPEKVHPVLLGDTLRKTRDAGAGERMHRGSLYLSLPFLDMCIRAVVKEQIVRECKYVLHLLKITTEHLREVAQQAGLPGHIVQEPCGAVHPVQVSAGILHDAPATRSGKDLDLGKVPFGGKNELAALLQGCVKVCRIRMEPHIVIYNAPVLVGIMLLSVLVHRIGLRGSVLPSSVIVDTNLVYRAGFGRSACSHGYRYKY